MSSASDARVAIVGESWSARIVEGELRAAGYSACRVAAADDLPDDVVAAVVVGDALAAVRAAHRRGAACIAVHARVLTEADVVATFCAGADAVVDESDGIEAVLGALDAVASGEMRCSPRTARSVVDALRRELSRRKPRVELTARQHAVLELIARGESVKQTARSLGIAVKTVENTQSRLYRRLGVRTRAQAIAVALAEGLIDSGRVGVLAAR